jgi:peptide/nickel transport system permease protein
MAALLHLLRTLVRSIAVFLLVCFGAFALMYGNGRGIARGILGLTATPEQLDKKVEELGLDRPLFVQFVDWLGGALTGNLGRSYFTGEAVSSAIQNRVAVTLSLVIPTVIIAVILSALVGVAAAYYGGWVDKLVQTLTGIGAAIPSFIVAVVLVFAFAVAIPLFPATGYIPLTQSVGGWISSITLPIIALLIGTIAGLAAQVRGAVIDTQSKDFVRTLRARGVAERAIVFRHVLRSASGPALAAIGLIVVGLLGGVIFIENIFAMPGIGQLLNVGAQAGDIPMVMGGVLVTILIVLVVNFTVDIANVVLNPKARTR